MQPIEQQLKNNGLTTDQVTNIESQVRNSLTPITAPSQKPATITAEGLNPPTPLYIPSPYQNSPASSIITDVGTRANSQIAQAQQEFDALNKAVGNKAETESSAMFDYLKKLFNQRGEAQANQANLEEQAGIQKERQALNEINTDIANQQIAYRAEQDRIRATPSSAEQKQTELGNLNDTYGRRLADLAIRQSAARGNIQGIQEDAARKTELLLAPIDNALTYYREFGQKNIDNLTQKEKDKLTFLQNSLEKQKQEIKDLQKAKSDTLIEISKESGKVPSDLTSRINNAQSIEEVARIAAETGLIGLQDRLYKQAQIANINADAQKKRADAAQADISSGFLTETQLKNIDNSPQGKKLKALTDLKTVQDRYKNLVETYGFQAAGEEKALLDKAYADLKIAYKEAANLGALTGPDVGLITEAVKPSSGVTNYFNYVTSGGQSGIIRSLNDAAKKAKVEALTNYKNLTLRNPSYSGSDYVKSFIDPYATDIENFTQDQLQKVEKGEIIRTPEGAYLESLGDGNFTQI